MIWWRAVAALVVAVALQVGTNYANDYSDGIRGTDDARVGPVRLVASGLASPRAVKRAAVAAFGVAGVAGLALAAAAGWWLIPVGAACIAAGWLYTGGPRPYGYVGLGELFVFVFFGLVATAGTAYVQLERITGLAVAAGAPSACSPWPPRRQQPPRHPDGTPPAASARWRSGSGPRATRFLYAGRVCAVRCGRRHGRRPARGPCWRWWPCRSPSPRCAG